MAVFKNSRYIKTSAYLRDGNTLILSIRNRVKFDAEKSTFYRVVQGDTLDGIAYKQYGNAQLWWAIMEANPLYQSEIDIKPGTILMIPSFEQVVKAIG